MNTYFPNINIKKISNLLALLVVAAVLLLSTQSARASVNAEFSLSPASKSVTVGSNLTLDLNLDTGGNSVLAWKTTISYSTTYFDSVSVQTDPSSHFTLNPGTDTASGGTIKLARYATSASTTSGPMAKITLHSSKIGTSTLSFAHICTTTADNTACSGVTDASGTNLLSANTGGSYTISAVPASSGSTTASTKKKSIFSKVADAVANVVSPSTSANEMTTDADLTTAKRGVVRITVLNQDKKPIEGAKVTLAGVSSETNKKGQVTLAGIYPGTASGSVSFDDRTQNFSLNVESGTTESSPQIYGVTFSQKTGLNIFVKLMLALIGLLMLIGVIDLAFVSKGGFKANVDKLFHHGGDSDVGGGGSGHTTKHSPTKIHDRHESMTPGLIVEPSSKGSNHSWGA